jgi:hypothetical protein
VTLNPALDISMSVDQLVPERPSPNNSAMSRAAAPDRANSVAGVPVAASS